MGILKHNTNMSIDWSFNECCLLPVNQTNNGEFTWNPTSQFQNFSPFQYHSVPTVQTSQSQQSNEPMWFDETIRFPMNEQNSISCFPRSCQPPYFQSNTLSFDNDMFDISMTEQLLQDPVEELDNSVLDFLLSSNKCKQI